MIQLIPIIEYALELKQAFNLQVEVALRLVNWQAALIKALLLLPLELLPQPQIQSQQHP